MESLESTVDLHRGNRGASNGTQAAYSIQQVLKDLWHWLTTTAKTTWWGWSWWLARPAFGIARRAIGINPLEHSHTQKKVPGPPPPLIPLAAARNAHAQNTQMPRSTGTQGDTQTQRETHVCDCVEMQCNKRAQQRQSVNQLQRFAMTEKDRGKKKDK